MKNIVKAVMLGALAATAMGGVAMAAGKTIAVSWKTFQEERWKTDEAAIKAVVEAAGDKYVVDRRAGLRPEAGRRHRKPDRQKPDVILVVAFDSDAILPSIQGDQRRRHQGDRL